MKKLPKVLWIRWERDVNSDDGYFVCEEDASSFAIPDKSVLAGEYFLRSKRQITARVQVYPRYIGQKKKKRIK